MDSLNANDLEAIVADAVHEGSTISNDGLDGANGREQGASRDEYRGLNNSRVKG